MTHRRHFTIGSFHQKDSMGKEGKGKRHKDSLSRKKTKQKNHAFPKYYCASPYISLDCLGGNLVSLKNFKERRKEFSLLNAQDLIWLWNLWAENETKYQTYFENSSIRSIKRFGILQRIFAHRELNMFWEDQSCLSKYKLCDRQ